MSKLFSLKKSWNKKHLELELFGIKLNIKLIEKIYSDKDLFLLQKKYTEIAKKLKGKSKIKVAFLVGLSSMFSARALFERMLKNDKFDVSLIIFPDLRFIEQAKENQQTAIEELSQYKDIMHIVPINEKDDNIDIKSLADIVVFSLPYDLTHVKYDVKNLIKIGILPVLVNYAFYRSSYDRGLIANEMCSLFWKIYVETELNLQEYKTYQRIKGANTLLTGYCKMDNYRPLSIETSKKTIIIAPHHSIEGGYNDTLALSNFYKYSELFLKLPEMYPDINFIFRPHPALFMLLSHEKYWGEEKVNNYIKQITSYKNVIYSKGGDYFKEFARSDGIIQDCGSYLVEYFYTQKPHCYLLKSPDDINNKFTLLGQQCLDNCYIAYDEKAIIDFIENVIIKGIDPKKEKRQKFAQEVVMYNYPNASENIIKSMEKLLQ